MIETILISIFLFALLWPYFIYLDVMNFKKDPNTMEAHLPGRPARRTIGRKNEDVSKGIGYIFVGYSLINIAIYAFLDYQDLLPSFALGILGWVALAIAMFLFSPANRMMHAYADLGHIAVTHLVAGLSTFLIVIAVVYGYAFEGLQAVYIGLMVIGGMLIFSERPNVSPKKTKLEEEEF